jgi:hypothetical protein
VPDEQSLDVCDLEQFDKNLPFQLITQLLSGAAFNLPLTPGDRPSMSDDMLSRMIKQDATLTLSYPYLSFERKPEDSIVAPLFFFSVKLHFDKNTEKWAFIQEDGQNPSLNPALEHYLNDHFDLSLSAVLQKVLGDKLLDVQTLLAFTQRLVVRLGLEGTHSNVSLVRFPENYDGNQLNWCGLVSGLNPAQQAENTAQTALVEVEDHSEESVEALADVLEAHEETAPIIETPEVPAAKPNSWYRSLSPFNTDPYQTAVLHEIQDAERLLVVGKPNAGKTYAISATLAKAMANHKKTLLVFQNAEAVRQIQNQLESIGLGSNMLVLQDPTWDRPRLIGLLREMAENPGKAQALGDENFRRLELISQKALREMEEAHEALNKQMLGELSWRGVIGLYYDKQNQQGKELLSSFADKAMFSWNEAEYSTVRAEITENEDFFRFLGQLNHPLEALNDNMFAGDSDLGMLEIEVETKLKAIVEDLTKHYHKLVVLIERYTDSLNYHYEYYSISLKRLINSLREDLKEYQSVYGTEFDNWGTLQNTKLKVFGIFSEKYKSIQQAKESILKQYETLQFTYDERKYFAFNFPVIKTSTSLEKLTGTLDDLERSVNEWQKSVPSLVFEDTRRLSSQISYSGLGFKHEIDSTDEALKQFLLKLNEEALFAETAHVNAILLVGKREQVGRLLDQYSKVYQAMRDFPAYSRWKRHWLQISPKAKALVEALTKLKPLDWQTAYDSWYLFNWLGSTHETWLPNADTRFEERLLQIAAYRDALPKVVAAEKQARFLEALDKVKRADKKQFQEYFGKKNLETLSSQSINEILAAQAATLQEMYPVIAMSADIAATVYPAMAGRFDICVFDNAESVMNSVSEHIVETSKSVLAFAQPQHNAPNTQDATLYDVAVMDRWTQTTLEAAYGDPSFKIPAFERPAADATNIRRSIIQWLEPYISRERFQKMVETDAGVIDILVKPINDKQKPMGIIIDGPFRSTTPLSVESNYQALSRFENQGIQVFLAWTSEWWRNPSLFARKLAAQILQSDKEFHTPEPSVTTEPAVAMRLPDMPEA